MSFERRVATGAVPSGRPSEPAPSAEWQPPGVVNVLTGGGADCGPVLCAMPFESDDEAIRLANDTPFGLAAS